MGLCVKPEYPKTLSSFSKLFDRVASKVKHLAKGLTAKECYAILKGLPSNPVKMEFLSVLFELFDQCEAITASSAPQLPATPSVSEQVGFGLVFWANKVVHGLSVEQYRVNPPAFFMRVLLQVVYPFETCEMCGKMPCECKDLKILVQKLDNFLMQFVCSPYG